MSDETTTVTSDPTVPQVDDAVAETPVEEVPKTTEELIASEAKEEATTRRQEISALAKAEKARWKERQALKMARTQLEAREASREAELQAHREELSRARSNPLDYLEERGVTPEQLIQRGITRGTVEEQVAQLKAQLDDERQAREAEKKERQEAERRQNERAYNERLFQAEKEFVTFVMKDEDGYPALTALYTDKQLASEAWQVVSAAAKKGYHYTDKEIADYLERRETARYQKALSRQGKATAVPGEKKSEQPSAVSGRQASKPGVARTLSNASASERATGDVPLDRLPEKEQNRILAEQLRKSIAARS